MKKYIFAWRDGWTAMISIIPSQRAGIAIDIGISKPEGWDGF